MRYTLIATKRNEKFEKKYNMYCNALTIGLSLKNKGWEVKIKEI